VRARKPWARALWRRLQNNSNHYLQSKKQGLRRFRTAIRYFRRLL